MNFDIGSILVHDYNECLDLLDKGIHTFVTRPTFYPKEELISRLINRIPGKKLIVHMNDDDRLKIRNGIIKVSECEFVSYRKLALSGVNSLGKDYRVIMFNEANLIGGDKVGKQIDMLIALNSNAVRLGITSTPFRGDGRNIRAEYFTFEITKFGMEKAIETKIIPSLYYVYCIDTNEDNNIKDILNLKGIINRTLKEVYRNKIPDKLDIVCFINGGIKKNLAYSNLAVTLSETFESSSITLDGSLIKWRNTNKSVGVITNPNLNKTIPRADIAILFRKTSSQRVFIKQLGTVLDCNNTNTPIIFDLVDNLNRDSILQLTASQISNDFRQLAGVQISKVIVKDYVASNGKITKKVDTQPGIGEEYKEKQNRQNKHNYETQYANTIEKLKPGDIDYKRECLSRSIIISNNTLNEDYINRVIQLRYNYKMPIYKIIQETGTPLEMVIIALSLDKSDDDFLILSNDKFIYSGPKVVSKNVNLLGAMRDYSRSVRMALLKKKKLTSGLSRIIGKTVPIIEENIVDRIYRLQNS